MDANGISKSNMDECRGCKDFHCSLEEELAGCKTCKDGSNYVAEPEEQSNEAINIIVVRRLCRSLVRFMLMPEELKRAETNIDNYLSQHRHQVLGLLDKALTHIELEAIERENSGWIVREEDYE